MVQIRHRALLGICARCGIEPTSEVVKSPIRLGILRHRCGRCHLHLNPSYSAKEEKKSRVEKLCGSIITEIATDGVADQHQKKYQRKLSLESLAFSIDPKPNPEHMVE